MANNGELIVVALPPDNARRTLTARDIEPCIWRVPKNLRENNEYDYVPRVVSIGPLNYGGLPYSSMERVKVKILDFMLKETGKTFQYLFDVVREYEGMVRACYNEKVELCSGEFVRMMLFDAAFVIFNYIHAAEYKEKWLAMRHRTVDAIKHDLLLWENQLPSFLLKTVYKNLYGGIIDDSASLLPNILKELVPGSMFQKFTQPEHWRNAVQFPASHLVDLLRFAELYEDLTKPDKDTPSLIQQPIYNATKLHKAGIKIQGSRHSSSFLPSGELFIKQVEINDYSLTIYRNIMAMEQCIYPKEPYVSNKFILLDALLKDGCEDEELLLEKGVIKNSLSYGQFAGDVIHELCKSNITRSNRFFSMGNLCKAANKYCDRPAGKIRAVFSDIPLNVYLAIILLLSLIRTIFSVLALLRVKFGHPCST